MKASAYVSLNRLGNHINKSLFSLAAILLLCVPSFGQTQTPPVAQKDEPSKNRDDGVVRITTTLVQVDVMVTDKKGRQVRDLKAEDFEILEDGRPQKITNFSYISLQPSTSLKPVRPAEKGVIAVPAPPTALRPEQVRRTIAIVVDDLGLSFESVHFAREAIKKFVETQLQPGDLAAIIPTSGGIGTLEQFTSDKRQLFAALEQVRWQLGRSGVSSFEPAGFNSEISSGRDGLGDAESELNEIREQFFSVGTLGAISHIVRGLKRLPGRKAVVVVSDGFPIQSRKGENNFRVLEALRRLTEFINRSSVVAYAIDARGLPTLGLTAADDLSGASSTISSIGLLNANGDSAGGGRLQDRITNTLDARRDQYFKGQDGLRLLAQETGGFFTSELNNGLKNVMEEQSGYYLIGYDPDESTFSANGRAALHKLSVKVKGSGLRVRTRSGFYGVEDEETIPANRTRSEQMIEALTSPFASDGISLSLTPLFNHEDKKGSFLRSLIHIDSNSLSFVDEEEGWRKSDFDVLAVAYGENFRIIDQVNRTYTMRVRGETYERIRKEGLLYVFDFPVKKAGAYQLRVAVRDSSSERVGSANQFVEVPDIKKGRIVQSGIVLSREQPVQQSAESTESVSQNLVPAVRKFKRGASLRYDYYIYNAKTDGKTQHPQIKTQIRLYRNGQLTYTGNQMPFEGTVGKDARQKLIAGGRLYLGAAMEPGQYILQVIVTDELAKENRRTAAQWIDFDIVE